MFLDVSFLSHWLLPKPLLQVENHNHGGQGLKMCPLNGVLWEKKCWKNSLVNYSFLLNHSTPRLYSYSAYSIMWVSLIWLDFHHCSLSINVDNTRTMYWNLSTRIHLMGFVGTYTLQEEIGLWGNQVKKKTLVTWRRKNFKNSLYLCLWFLSMKRSWISMSGNLRVCF